MSVFGLPDQFGRPPSDSKGNFWTFPDGRFLDRAAVRSFDRDISLQLRGLDGTKADFRIDIFFDQFQFAIIADKNPQRVKLKCGLRQRFWVGLANFSKALHQREKAVGNAVGIHAVANHSGFRDKHFVDFQSRETGVNLAVPFPASFNFHFDPATRDFLTPIHGRLFANGLDRHMFNPGVDFHLLSSGIRSNFDLCIRPFVPNPCSVLG